jgi:purine-binding chemotaxis protein CheW
MLTFRVGEQIFALPADRVVEVAPMPRVSRVPHAPFSLLGLANVLGSVLPVVSAARMLDCADGLPTRIIVVDGGDGFGLAVDETRQLLPATQLGEVRELDLAGLIAQAMPAGAPRPSSRARAAASPAVASDVDTVDLVAFAVGGQEFALPLAVVDEVLPVPGDIALVPDADEAVIGVTAWRGTVLPLLALRALLGLRSDPARDAVDRRRVLVVHIGRQRIGLLVDGMRAILQAADTAIDVLPQVLNRGTAEARIQAICRLDNGERLVSILAADHLVRPDVTAKLLQGVAVEHNDVAPQASAKTGEQFLLFRIGNDEFGLPVGAVEEVVPLPEKLTRLPRAPAFIQGLMNLRGQVIPVIDQAQRFGAPLGAPVRRRVIVVRIGDLQAGFIVDAVSEVATIDAADLAVTPDLGSDQTRVFEKVANLADQQRMILIVSPRELLGRAEQDLLRGLATSGANPAP